MSETHEIQPHKDWRCSEDECPSYDGKRCMALGFRPGVFCEPKLDQVRKSLRKKNKRIRKLKVLIADLSYDDPCDLDHHGSCQAHNWFGDGECPHARARKALKQKL